MLSHIDTLAATWNSFTEIEQLAEWRSFLSALDEGGAGYNRFYLLLLPLWDAGDVPASICDEASAAYDAECAEEAAWEVDQLIDSGLFVRIADAAAEEFMGLY